MTSFLLVLGGGLPSTQGLKICLLRLALWWSPFFWYISLGTSFTLCVSDSQKFYLDHGHIPTPFWDTPTHFPISAYIQWDLHFFFNWLLPLGLLFYWPASPSTVSSITLGIAYDSYHFCTPLRTSLQSFCRVVTHDIFGFSPLDPTFWFERFVWWVGGRAPYSAKGAKTG